ncbi:hypothetical protein NQ318_014776 [Aromia moschata]|uniref:Reverse transcriptase domain-containing protein n=1 Tax=Aromia moschata TaxID=1265417 RepID=A0AAV8ZBQ5_9CUCU|nr:hypothetical protein NQ318_014776 [Aromia moschata]
MKMQKMKVMRIYTYFVTYTESIIVNRRQTVLLKRIQFYKSFNLYVTDMLYWFLNRNWNRNWYFYIIGHCLFHRIWYRSFYLNFNRILNRVCLQHKPCNGEYFQKHEGTAMGNSLSPFIANLFMSKETEVKDKFEYFPRVWFRYVDDIFAVFDTKAISLDNFVVKLNNRFPTIKFTYGVEHNEQLPFLDVLVIRNSENKLEFDVYRKETATLRYIPNDSHHPFQHKMASFNFLIHRLLNSPSVKRGLNMRNN